VVLNYGCLLPSRVSEGLIRNVWYNSYRNTCRIQRHTATSSQMKLINKVMPCLWQGLVNHESQFATVCSLFAVTPSISHMYCEIINVLFYHNPCTTSTCLLHRLFIILSCDWGRRQSNRHRQQDWRSNWFVVLCNNCVSILLMSKKFWCKNFLLQCTLRTFSSVLTFCMLQGCFW
jgi:hypothetical protein